MKGCLIVLTIAFNVFAVIGQNNKIPILKDCDGAENELGCSYFKIHNLILEKLNNSNNIEFKTNKKEIIFSTLLRIESDGSLDESNSIIYSSAMKIKDNFDDVLDSIPDFNINYNDKGKPITAYYRNTFYFRLTNETFEYWNNSKANTKDFYIPEKVPVFKGCKPKWSNKRLKECMAQQIAGYLQSSSSLKNLAKKIKLLPGKEYKILAYFKVNRNGEIINIGARGPHEKLEQEVIRLISKLQKLEPGYIAHKTVTVPYSLPIIYRVNY